MNSKEKLFITAYLYNAGDARFADLDAYDEGVDFPLFDNYDEALAYYCESVNDDDDNAYCNLNAFSSFKVPVEYFATYDAFEKALLSFPYDELDPDLKDVYDSIQSYCE